MLLVPSSYCLSTQVKDHMIAHLLKERDALKVQLKKQTEDSVQVRVWHFAWWASFFHSVITLQFQAVKAYQTPGGYKV